MNDSLLEMTVAKILDDHCTHSARQDAERDGWAEDVWRPLAEAEIPWVGVAEDRGGAGGSLGDACAVVRQIGFYAAPVPVPETGLLAGALAAAYGLTIPRDVLSIAVPTHGDELTVDASGRVTGVLQRVPWAHKAAAVVASAKAPGGPRLVVLGPGAGRLTNTPDLAGEPRGRLEFDAVAVAPGQIADGGPDLDSEILLRGAVSRVQLIGGASQAVSRMAVKYAHERDQFGKKIGTFQAVSTRIARMVEEAEAAMLGAKLIGLRLESWNSASLAGLEFEIAAAKASAARSAAEVAKQAHQIHGAIGMTQEYSLHQFTRRLWVWAHEYGSQRFWTRRIGRRIAPGGAAAAWTTITSNSYPDGN
jgi:acyl-CoA dehydrogenase